MPRCFEIMNGGDTLKISAEIDGRKFFMFVEENEAFKGVRVYEEEISCDTMVYDSNHKE